MAYPLHHRKWVYPQIFRGNFTNVSFVYLFWPTMMESFKKKSWEWISRDSIKLKSLQTHRHRHTLVHSHKHTHTNTHTQTHTVTNRSKWFESRIIRVISFDVRSNYFEHVKKTEISEKVFFGHLIIFRNQERNTDWYDIEKKVLTIWNCCVGLFSLSSFL